jgi:hypothetical protein
LGLVFMFCAPALIFGCTEGVVSRFHVLRSRTRCRRCRMRRVPLSCFALLNSFSTVPRALVPVFMFCAPGLVFSGAECVASRFHVLRSRIHFSRYRRRRFTFSYFALPNSFEVVPRASGPAFMFCAPGLVVDSTEGLGSRFHVLRSRTRCRWCRVRRVPYSYFARAKSFLAVLRASVPVFMF